MIEGQEELVEPAVGETVAMEFSFIPAHEETLLAIAGGSFSGKIIEKDQAKVDAVLHAFNAGAGKARIAEYFRISKNTVRGILRRAEVSGKIDPYKKRMALRLEQAIEAGVEQYQEALDEGKIAAAQIPIGIGILFDKKQVLGGDATSIVEHRQQISAEDVAAHLAALPEATILE